MAFYLTTEGVVAERTPDSGAHDHQRLIASKDEWEAVAGEWPLKRLIAIWNGLPGVTPVEKFTSRRIAVQRIWRAVEFPEQARPEATARNGNPKRRFREGSAGTATAPECRAPTEPAS